MIRKLIYYSMCMVCLALGGCTDDNMIPASQTEPSGQVVPVKLLLTTEVYNTPLSGKTRNEETNHVFSASYPEMDIELVETPATRAVAPGVEDAIYTYTILQFKGVTDAATLYYKKTYDCPDGVINTQNVELETTDTGPNGAVEKHRFVVIANDNSGTLDGLTKDVSTYTDLQNLFITRAASDQHFPLHNIRVSGAIKQAMIMCGIATASIDAQGKQISVAMQRTVAKVTFNIETDNPAFDEFKNWDVTLINIPTKSYLNILGRSAVFPGIDQMNRASAYWSKVLTEPIGETLPMGKSSYLPVNLQQTVITSTQATRRDNAPIGGTYVQIMGRRMAAAGTTTLPVVQDFVIYQIFLGKNLSTDYSVYPNNNLTYNITLKGRNEEDTNVVRFIPGRFSGALKAYTEDGSPAVTSAQAVEWKYEKRIEAYFADASYSYKTPPGQEIEQLGRYDLRWYVGTAYDNKGATSLTNGYNNTRLLVSNSSTFYRYPAALACYGGLNGLNQGAQSGFKWYLPSITELIGTWISASSVASTLNTSYWSSTALNNASKAFLITNEGEVRAGAVNNESERHFIRGVRDPDMDNAK